MSSNELDRLIQQLEELSFQSQRSAQWLKDQEVRLHTGFDRATPPLASAPTEKVSYPFLVDRVTVNWAALRMVVSSKLSKLVADGTHKPRTAEDKGYAWLAEQVGVSHHTARVFLQNPERVAGAEIFVRFALWTGHPIEDFLDGVGE